MKRLRGKLTYANVMATIAMFLVLAGGTAFAAKESLLPKNSVGARQLKPGAVTPTKLNQASIAALVGPRGATGDTGAKGERGPQGPEGSQGIPGTTGNEPLLVDAGGQTAGLGASSNVPLSGPTSWTASEGQAGLLFGRITTTLGTKTFGYPCLVSVSIEDNGAQVGAFSFYVDETGTNELDQTLAPTGIAIHEPGSHTITATATGGSECNATSKIDSMYLMVAPMGR